MEEHRLSYFSGRYSGNKKPDLELPNWMKKEVQEDGVIPY